MRPILLSILVLALSWLLLSTPAGAATLVADGATCTLTDAIVAANTNSATNGCAAGDDVADTIVLDADVVLSAVEPSSTTIGGGQSGLPDVTADLTIVAGLGNVVQRDSSFTCDALTVDPTFRFLYLAAGSLVIDGLSFEDGCFVSADAEVEGGGLRTGDGSALELVDVHFRQHGTFATGGEILGGLLAYGDSPPLLTGGSFEDIHIEAQTRVKGGILHSLDNEVMEVQGTHFLDVTVVAGGEIVGGAIQSGNGLTLADAVFSGFEVMAEETVAGGALNVAPQFLIVERSTFDDFTVAGTTGVNGGAIHTATPYEIRDSMFTGIAATSESICQGGGLYLAASAASVVERIVVRDTVCRGALVQGGGAYLPGEVTVRDCLFAHNQAEYGTAGQGGGAYCPSPQLLFERCTFVGNEVVPADVMSTGDALGGGFWSSNSATLRNVTFSGNRVVGSDGTAAGTDGGDADGGGLWVVGTTDLSHLTVVGNEAIAGAGAGGFDDGEARGGGLHTPNGVEIDNSILSGNSVTAADGTTSAEDCSNDGSLISNGFNLAFAPEVSCDFSAFGDVVGVDPELYPVADYGCVSMLPDGTCVPTAAIDQDSPAVDQGSCAESGAVVDARGFDRPFDLVAVADLVDACDVGAFEARDTDGDGVTDEADPCPDDATDACIVFTDDFETGDKLEWSSSEP